VLVLLAAAVFTIATSDFTDAAVIVFRHRGQDHGRCHPGDESRTGHHALSELTAPDARAPNRRFPPLTSSWATCSFSPKVRSCPLSPFT
jgi:hypothetical protein